MWGRFDLEASVFPAPAGMNRKPADLRVNPRGVPRACGDEPLVQSLPDFEPMCSPRLRG